MNNKKGIKTAVYIALLAGIGTILNFIEIPYIIPYLKLDISEVITLIAATISYPVAIGVALVKFIFMSLTGTSTGFIGEMTLLIGSFSIIIIYSLLKDKLKTPFVLFIIIIAFTFIMTALNYFIITPFYFGQSFSELVNSSQKLGDNTYSYLVYIIIIYVPFNLIKISIDGVIFYFLNKKLKKVL